MVISSDDRKLIYEHPRFRDGTIARLFSVPGKRQYSPEIMAVDRIVVLEIEKPSGAKADVAYSITLQKELWKRVFEIWVKPEKKAKYAEEFKKFITEQLQQAKLEIF